MNARVFLGIGLGTLLNLPLSAFAQEGPSPSLWHPTPDEDLRELRTDRPDKTEGPYTVEPGRLQFETDLLNFSTDEEDGVTTKEMAAMTTNLRLGVTKNLDVHLILAPYVDQEIGDSGLRSGVGDTNLRCKYNLFGNEGDDSALAILPFVTIPNAEDDLGARDVEGGLLLPFATDLAGSLGIGLMAGYHVVSQAKDEYLGAVTASVSLGYEWTDDLGSYIEVWADQVAQKEAQTEVTLDLGVTFQAEDFQLDAGINLGVSSVAPDLNPFIGLSGRI